MRPRLLIHAHDWAPTVGGVQSVTMDLARGICDWSKAHPGEAWDVTVVTQTPAGDMDDSLLPFRVVRQPSAAQLFRLIRSTDVLHLAGPALLPMSLAFVSRKPFVVEHHGYQSICPNGLLLLGPEHELCPGHFMAGHYAMCVRCNSKRVGFWKSLRDTILNFPRRWLCKGSAANIAVSDHVAGRIDLPGTKTIFHGIQDIGETTQGRSTEGRKFQIAYVGRFVTEKGVSLLIDAAKELKDMGVPFHLTLVGDGPERDNLERQVHSSGLTDCATFTGYLTGQTLEKQIRLIDAVVIPSRCEETAGLSAIEHMMRGGVVLAANIGGLAEVVGDGGFIFKPMDARGLAETLRRIWQDPSGRAEISTRARARALEFFRIEKMVAKHIALYQNVRLTRGHAF